MTDATDDPQHYDKSFVSNVVESALRVGLLFILAVWSYEIVKPFAIPVIWGAIIAVAGDAPDPQARELSRGPAYLGGGAGHALVHRRVAAALHARRQLDDRSGALAGVGPCLRDTCTSPRRPRAWRRGP